MWLRVPRRILLAGGAAVCVIGAGTAIALAATSTGTTNGTPVSGMPAAGSPSGTAAAAPVDTKGFPSGAKQTGIFTDRCAYSHEAADDAILAPGKPGVAMHHEFFGNTGTDASSTTAGLVGGRTTCSTTADASGYWIPVLYQNGKTVQPSSALIYWRQRGSLAGKVQPMPVGLTMIAGNETTTAPQSRSVVQWSCKVGKGRPDKQLSSAPPTCASGQVKLTIFFPSCWDGHTLNGASQTNVVYPGTTGCPSSHPVEIPQIVFHTTYAISDPSGLTLSMSPTMTGSTNTAHADFMNGWTQSVLTADTKACIATNTRCGPVSGATATPKGPSPAQRTRRHMSSITHRAGHK